MTTKPRCRECGDTKPLNDLGVCEWRHGCEHRQFVHEATMARLAAEMDHQAWHARARDAAMRRHPGFKPLSEGPEATNLWIDEWLRGGGDQ